MKKNAKFFSDFKIYRLLEDIENKVSPKEIVFRMKKYGGTYWSSSTYYSPLIALSIDCYDSDMKYLCDVASELLTEALIDPNGAPHNSRYALHWMASQGQASLAHILFQHGADLNKVNSLNQTPAELCDDPSYAKLKMALEDPTDENWNSAIVAEAIALDMSNSPSKEASFDMVSDANSEWNKLFGN